MFNKPKKSQRLIDATREYLDLPDSIVSDDDLWVNMKDSWVVAKINLALAMDDLKKELRKIIRGYLGR